MISIIIDMITILVYSVALFIILKEDEIKLLCIAGWICAIILVLGNLIKEIL